MKSCRLGRSRDLETTPVATIPMASISLLVLAALLCGSGCPIQQANLAPAAAGATLSGTLVQGQPGSIVVSCTATDADGNVESVAADLSAVGGSEAQPLASTGDGQWSWSGWVTPPATGLMTVMFTITDDDGASGTAQASTTVRQSDAGTPCSRAWPASAGMRW